jgi:hypothetical protein
MVISIVMGAMWKDKLVPKRFDILSDKLVAWAHVIVVKIGIWKTIG